MRAKALLGGIRTHVQHRAASWARRRQGEDRGVTTLDSRRVYILPTGVGTTYSMVVFVMLLGAMNYSNSMAFVLTFFLAAIGLVAMHHCHRNIAGVAVRFAGADPVFAGEQASFRIALENRSRSPRYDLFATLRRLRSASVDIGPGDAAEVVLKTPSRERGWLVVERFGISTRHPLALFRAWAWIHASPRCLVWPQPADDAPPLPVAISDGGAAAQHAGGNEDFAGLRDFQLGDSPRHIAWKTFARSGELKSKRFAGANLAPTWLDLDTLRDSQLERALAVLARWVIDADAQSMTYGLRLGSISIPPADGRQHRDRCLDALALHGLRTATRTDHA